MTKLILIILLFILTACGYSNWNNDVTVVPILNEFNTDYHSNVLHFHVYLDILPQGVLGKCHMSSHRYIVLNRDWWNNSSYLQRRVVLYHELGHCVFLRNHDDRIFVDSHGNLVPVSLMNSEFSDELTYEYNWRYYVNELKGGSYDTK